MDCEAFRPLFDGYRASIRAQKDAFTAEVAQLLRALGAR